MKENKPKDPKRAKIAINHLHDILEQLRFFYGNEERFRKDIFKQACYIEDVLLQLSVDKKSFSGKLRNIFGQQAEDLREENQELKQELKARGEKIGELVEEVKELKEE